MKKRETIRALVFASVFLPFFAYGSDNDFVMQERMDMHVVVHELLNKGEKIVKSLPNLVFCIIILLLAWLLAKVTYKLVILFSLLNAVMARVVSFCVFLLGVYFIFEVAELTTLAITIISGTGLIGIVLGIAFRDIAENFLSSILLSIQHPFSSNDLVEITMPGTNFTIKGYVERLTTRVTILLTVDGKRVQIPNATVYKGIIANFIKDKPHPLEKGADLLKNPKP